uniref:Protein quiver n=1 Tax=Mesocestoides corti TaxID=53468 RepID=A0A5K3EW14_MESCO
MLIFQMIVSNLICFIVLLSHIFLFDAVRGQDAVPCAPRKISCFFCNSSKFKACEDPFPKRDVASPLLPTVDCYEDCFKWLYIDLQQKHQLIRGCSSQLSLQIDRHLICMYESKNRGGYICFCSAEKCNAASFPHVPFWTFASIYGTSLLFRWIT